MDEGGVPCRTRPLILSAGGVFPQPIRSSLGQNMAPAPKMQLTNAPDENQFPRVVAALQAERISRYFPAAGKQQSLAFQFYLWNCVICESFHFALHFAEIACRNSIHNALLKRLGDDWFRNELLHRLLDDRYYEELAKAVDDERSQHGNYVTGHHIVSALSFGFWEHLATKRFDRFLWAKGPREVFPNAPNGMSREEIQKLIESVRRWRNRIAHHRAIFDKGPTRKHQDALDLIKIVCADTFAWVASNSKVPEAIRLRPG
jgi:hypothetical protein